MNRWIRLVWFVLLLGQAHIVINRRDGSVAAVTITATAINIFATDYIDVGNDAYIM